jgi:hypothetical protein
VQQLVQAREGHPHLGLDAHGAQDEPVRGAGLLSGLSQKHRLTATWITADQQDARAGFRGGDGAEDRQLARAAKQGR